jgi:hypothetical protein
MIEVPAFIIHICPLMRYGKNFCYSPNRGRQFKSILQILKQKIVEANIFIPRAELLQSAASRRGNVQWFVKAKRMFARKIKIGQYPLGEDRG